MKAMFHANVLATLMGLSGSLPLSAAAQNLLDPLSQARDAFVTFQLVATDANGGQTFNAGQHEPRPLDQTPNTQPGGMLVFFDTGLQSATSLDGLATASGRGFTGQGSFVQPDDLSFRGQVGASASGTATPPGRFSASVLAVSNYDVTFTMAAAANYDLDMASALSPTGGSYTFVLTRNGSVVWDAEEVVDPHTGALVRTFTRTLVLEPGLYTLSAHVSAMAVADTSGAAAMDASGDGFFRLHPVPEPEAWALMLAGLGLLAARLRRPRDVVRPA
jgi:hypothetical protein